VDHTPAQTRAAIREAGTGYIMTMRWHEECWYTASRWSKRCPAHFRAQTVESK